MAVTAPFRFARIWKTVHQPAWGRLVSHGIPFADGVSGEATVTIVARTPLIVGGARRAATAQREGEVRPFQLPDGTWALPGSTLQGLSRSILEIASFGSLGPWIDDKRFSYRDLGTSQTAKDHYLSRLSTNVEGHITQHSKAGWLINDSDGIRIVPSKFARIHAKHIIEWKLGRPPSQNELDGSILAFGGGNGTAKVRVDWFCGARSFSVFDRKFYLVPPPVGGWSAGRCPCF